MEEQPSFEPQQTGTAQKAGALKRLAQLVVFGFLGAALYALVLGPRNATGLANGLFIAGAILLVIALFPLFGEVLGRSTVSFRRENLSVDDVLDEQRGRSQQGDTVTYLFGVAGIIMVVLSLILDAYSR